MNKEKLKEILKKLKAQREDFIKKYPETNTWSPEIEILEALLED